MLERATALGLVGLLGLAGCADPKIERADAIKERACACTTSACLDDAVAAFAAFDATAVPARYRARLEAIARDIVGCMERVVDAEAAPVAPAPAGSATGS